MARQYKRAYNLTIANESTALVITELRITFEVTKDLIGYPNLIKIDIYGLSDASRNKLENEFDRLALNVGYEGNLKLIFQGSTKNVTHNKLGEDTITTIYAGDGQRDYDNAYSSFTLGEGATIEDIINQIATSFENVRVGAIDTVSAIKDKLLGITVTSQSKDALDNLAEENNFDWSIQDGQLTIIDKDRFENIEYKITSATGMLGSPAVTEIGADVIFLLNPEVQPGRLLTIEALTSTLNLANIPIRNIKRTNATGRYKILKLVHNGDTHTDQWQTTVTGQFIQ